MRQEYSKEFLQAICDKYEGIGEIEHPRLFTSGYENSNYLVNSKSGKKVVKIFEGMGLARENIEFEVKVINHCYQTGIRTTHILKNFEGELLSEYSGKLAILMDYIDGQNMDELPMTDELVREIGEETAKMDRALEGFGDGTKTRQSYEFDAKNTLLLEKSISLLPPEFDQNIFRNIIDRFRKIKPVFDKLPTGLIHNDVAPHNVLTKNGQLLAIIDFSDLVYSPYIQNISVALHLIAFGYNWQPGLVKVFIDGYRKYRDLSNEEISLLFDLILSRFAQFVVEFNRWNVDYGADKQRTKTVIDQYNFLKKFLELGSLKGIL